MSKILDALEAYYSLSDYKLDWRNGERTLHELWRMHPPWRFNSFAITSLYVFAADFCPTHASVLDLGCGTGFGSYILASKTKAASVLAVDLDESSVSWGCTRYKRPNLTIRCLNMHSTQLDHLTGTLDFVYCSNVMEHIREYEKALDRIYRLLKPSGLYFHVTPPSGDPGNNKYHVTNFRIPQWKRILESVGFHSQRYFSHLNDVARECVASEFDFSFTECGPDDMFSSSGLGSISGIIVARKSYNPKSATL